MARRRKLEQLTDFKRALTQKYGLGEGAEYKPWIRVQDVNSQGHSGKIKGIKSGRTHHTLSEQESCFFYLAEYSDLVIDIREQFPLLPLDLSIKISKTLDVVHPKHPSSKVPISMTTDFLLTCRDGNNKWYEAVAVKPEEGLGDKRAAEKLDIERVWRELLGVPFHVFSKTKDTQIQSQNVQWVTSPLRQNHHQLDRHLYTEGKQLLSSGTALVSDICESFNINLGVTENKAILLLKSLISNKEIVVALHRPIAETGIVEIQELRALGRSQQNAS